MKSEKAMENTTTTVVELTKSSRVGQMTLVNSARTSLRKVLIFSHIPVIAVPRTPDYLPGLPAQPQFDFLAGKMQAWQDSNLQPPVLETGALPN